MKKYFLRHRNEEPSFPIGWLTAIMVFELLMIGLSVWLIGYTEVRVREGMKRQVRLERLRGDIIHLDEVLTMSAKMAASSGDLKWEQRYREYEPLLDDKIQDVMIEAEALSLDLAELGIATTNEANRRLVDIENQAFEAVRKQDTEQARRLLSSKDYTDNKDRYALGMKKLLTRLDSLVVALVDSQRNQIQAVQITSIFGWLLLIGVWIVVLKGIRKWRRALLTTQNELAVYQTQLEDKVFSMAKQLTRAEHRERQRIAGLLHDQLQQLLVAARLQLGLTPENSHRVQVNDLLEQSIKLSRSLTNELNPPGLMLGGFGDALRWLAEWVNSNHGLDITVTVDPQLPSIDDETKVIAFEGVRELLFNIVKHANSEEATITAGVSQEGNLQVDVRDRGVGFNQDVIWSGDRFGLLNTMRRLELIGGSLELESKLGHGSRGTMILPYTHTQKTTETVGESTSPDGHKTKVLIIDDHPVVRAGLMSTLQRVPEMQLREASGMADVLTTLESFEPDVAVVDISLGDGEPDGYEVARVLKERLSDIKVVAFTSYEGPVQREQMMAAGASRYLVKGCPTKHIIEAIRN